MHNVIRLGEGKTIVGLADYQGQVCVYLERADPPGVTGERAPDREDIDPTALILMCQSEDQANAVCDALTAGLRPSVVSVQRERSRQILDEGFSATHDAQYTENELILAARSHLLHAMANKEFDTPPRLWPFDPRWWKPTSPERSLVKAAALILAELDRRQAQGETGS